MGDQMMHGVEAMYDDLLRLPLEDPLAEANDFATQGYILLAGQGALLIDTVSTMHLPVLRGLLRAGKQLVGLLLTHFNVVPRGDTLQKLEQEFGLPIFLHPLDAAQPQAMAAQVRYHDPTGGERFDALGVEVTLFPGHSPGSVVVYWRAHGGVLFTGDAAVGPRRSERLLGSSVLVRPPPSLSWDDSALRRRWEEEEARPLATVLPLHGETIVGRAAELPAIMAPLRAVEPTPEFTVQRAERKYR
jgi:glyoxylase-like metal-dependent hydrolase (beta-lactamase superfamily II)